MDRNRHRRLRTGANGLSGNFRIIVIIQYKVGKVKDGKTSVEITIRIPERPPYEPVNLQFTMYLVYENESWRIDDWFDWNDGMNGSMRKALRGYIRWFADQIPERQ